MRTINWSSSAKSEYALRTAKKAGLTEVAARIIAAGPWGAFELSESQVASLVGAVRADQAMLSSMAHEIQPAWAGEYYVLLNKGVERGLSEALAA